MSEHSGGGLKLQSKVHVGAQTACNTESLSLRFIGSSDALNVKELKTDKRQQRNTNKNSTLLTV